MSTVPNVPPGIPGVIESPHETQPQSHNGPLKGKSKKQIRREQFREQTAAHEAKIALQAMAHLQAGEPLLRYCIRCKASFRMDLDELRFYFDNELFLPRRCKPCVRIVRTEKVLTQ